MMIRRNSRQRQLILDVMRGEGIHMNADQVYQKVKQADPSIGIATVYRNLNLLTEMGEIQKFQDRSAGFMYDGNPKKHHHFYCRYCKRYFDVSFSVEEQMIRQVEDQMGVSVEDLNISLEGCCNQCKDQQEKEKVRGKEQWN